MAVLTRHFASERGDEMALTDDISSLTFGELDERVNQIIHSLRKAGLAAGDTIAIMSGNSNHWFETSLACAHAGITFVPVNWHLVPPEIAYILGDCGAKAVLTDYRYADQVAKALNDDRCSGIDVALGIGVSTAGQFRNFEEFVAEGATTEPDNQSFGGPMFYTSGTTGNPKGVKGSLSSMPPMTTPEVWNLIAAGFSDLVTPGGNHHLVRAGVSLGTVGILVPAPGRRLCNGDAAQIRQRRSPRAHRQAQRHAHAPRANPDEANG